MHGTVVARERKNSIFIELLYTFAFNLVRRIVIVSIMATNPLLLKLLAHGKTHNRAAQNLLFMSMRCRWSKFKVQHCRLGCESNLKSRYARPIALHA